MKKASQMFPILLLGAAGFAVWAFITDSQPALFYEERQALWLGGEFFIKATFVMTLFTVLSAVLLAYFSFAVIHALSRGRRGDVPERHHSAVRRARARGRSIGSIVILNWAVLTAVSVAAPDVSRFVGYLLLFGLFGVSIGLPLGLCILLDAVLPPVCITGAIEAMELINAERSDRDTTHWITVLGERCLVSAGTYEALRIGVSVTIVRTGLLNSVLALSAEPIGAPPATWSTQSPK